jgi:hypothetical protein
MFHAFAESGSSSIPRATSPKNWLPSFTLSESFFFAGFRVFYSIRHSKVGVGGGGGLSSRFQRLKKWLSSIFICSMRKINLQI